MHGRGPWEAELAGLSGWQDTGGRGRGWVTEGVKGGVPFMRQGSQEERPVDRVKGVLPRKKTRCVRAYVCTNTRETNMLHFKELIYITVRAIESLCLLQAGRLETQVRAEAAD